MRKILIACAAWQCSAIAAFGAASALPAGLKAPADAVLIGKYPAKGVQIYRCTPADGALRWTLQAPDANLTDGKGFHAHHFAGPTWKAANGAEVVGKVIAKAPAPSPKSVAWLLLSAHTTGTGPLAGTRFVQRLDTAGGAEPAGDCSTTGAELRVPYSAEYAFYR